MKLKVTPNCCRTCLQKTNKLRSIFKRMEDDDEAPHEMLKTLTGIKVDKTIAAEKQPVLICKDCILSLSIAYEFRAKALKSQMIIEAYFNIKNLATHNDEAALEKVEILEEAFSDDGSDAYLHLNFDTIYQSVDEETINVMHDEELSAETNNTLATSFEAIVKNEYMEGDNNFLKSMDNHRSRDIQARNSSIRNSKQLNRRGRKRIYDVRHSNGTQNSEYVLSTHDGESIVEEKIVRKADNGVGYICDICGNIYSKRFRMLEHRKGHDPELSHTCELCGKKFHLRERLRKHMYAHKDKKPHKCSFCSRTFFFESLKRTHEAIHLGSKPHVCDICNKAFAYSQALKNHQLIHAEIKHYHCDYCDKDFRLQHHLKQHEGTKLHKNAVKEAEKESY